MSIDENLSSLADDIRATQVEGSHLAKVWIRTGLNHAADLVEKRRVEILCDAIASETTEP
jgi:hypothetical protein